MKKINFLALLRIFLLLYLYTIPLVSVVLVEQKPIAVNDVKDPYFNTKFLAEYDKTIEQMRSDGFVDVQFNSTDDYELHGLLLQRDAASCTVICCVGFYPGRKEGMATLFKLLPDDCNILFFDARGHGESEGPFYSSVPWYGHEEYKDVLGAIDFIDHTVVNTPIVIHGVCAGSYHALRALIELGKEKNPVLQKIKGIVVDSGFDTPAPTTRAPRVQMEEKIIPSWFQKTIYCSDTREQVKERLLYQVTDTLFYVLYPLEFLAWCFFSCNAMSLSDEIHYIGDVPVLYIHAHNDTMSLCSEIELLIEKTPHAIAWIIRRGGHAVNHLKHPDEYAKRLYEFLVRVV